VTAEEVAGTGIRWAFAPCIAVVQDERWGRTYESYGESPGPVAELGAASVRGFQGQAFPPTQRPSSPAPSIYRRRRDQGGIDQGNTVCDEATLRKLYLPRIARRSRPVPAPSWFPTAVGTAKKCTGTNTCSLRAESRARFPGFSRFRLGGDRPDFADYKHDIEQAINAGLDMIMIPTGRDSRTIMWISSRPQGVGGRTQGSGVTH